MRILAHAFGLGGSGSDDGKVPPRELVGLTDARVVAFLIEHVTDEDIYRWTQNSALK